jgi:hypothetical protein
MTVCVLVVGYALACAVQPPPRQPALPVSVERIRVRLLQPVGLRHAVERQPDFRASVTEEFTPPETVLEALRRDLSGVVSAKRIPPGTISPPLVSVELLQVVSHLKRQLSAARRARAERNARIEVATALAEFCAQHDCSVLEQSQPRRSDGEGGKQSTPEGVLTH